MGKTAKRDGKAMDIYFLRALRPSFSVAGDPGLVHETLAIENTRSRKDSRLREESSGEIS